MDTLEQLAAAAPLQDSSRNVNQVMQDIIDSKERRFALKGAVYTGRMEGGQWVPSSLADTHQEFGCVETLDTVPQDDGDLKLVSPAVMDGLEFIGGTVKRGFYADMAVLESYPELWAWWQEKGDSHLLASMFLRPGKLAPQLTCTAFDIPERIEEGHDGLLMTMSREQWDMFTEAFELPECAWAQVTLFNPEGIIAKGAVRRVFDGETPARFPESWKWFEPKNPWFYASMMSVLTVDSVYNPTPSVNNQERTFAKYRGSKLAPWVFEELSEHIEGIVVGSYQSPDTAFGYLMSLGLAAPDSLKEEVLAGQVGSLERCFSRWPVKSGWRGKATASVNVRDGEVLLPRRVAGGVVGGEVYVSRNPNPAAGGYVKYKVAGFTSANLIVFAPNDKSWSAIHGGDYDGDDANVLFKAPFVGEPYTFSNFDLQEYKSDARKLVASSVEDRLARWHGEVNVAIGQPDSTIRKAIDMGVATDESVMDATWAVQYLISLKKRMGTYEEPGSITKLRSVLREVGEFSETHLLKNWASLSEEHRAVALKRADKDTQAVVQMVVDALEAVKLPKSRFSLKLVEEFLGQVETPAHLKAMAWTRYNELLGLGFAKLECVAEGDETSVLHLSRDIKTLCQVAIPRACLELGAEEQVRFAAALYQAAPQGTSLWLYAVPRSVWIAALKKTYAKEKQMLFSKDGHTLQVGDTVRLEPYSRTATYVQDGELVSLAVSNGIVVVEAACDATVVKVYAKSVVVEL